VFCIYGDKVIPIVDEDDVKAGAEDEKNLVYMSNYYNLRFGRCDSNSEGDFIDNITGALNIYVASGTDDDQNEYFLLYYGSKFSAQKDSSLHDNLGVLGKSLSSIFSEDVAKGLIQSSYDNDPDGIIDHAPDYEDHYFDTRDDDDIDGFIPCYFAVASVTYTCDCKVDIKSGNVFYNDEKIDNFSDFYGYLDEDESYTVGIIDFTQL